MGALTGLLYGLLAVFLGGWYFGKWTGNFSLLLLILTVVTFAYWLAERFYFLPKRRRAADTLDASLTQRREELARQGITQVDTVDHSARARRFRNRMGRVRGALAETVVAAEMVRIGRADLERNGQPGRQDHPAVRRTGLR